MANGRSATRFGSGLRASFVMFGTIVGAGIFGLPYMVQQAGYLAGLFWMLVLAVAVTLTHLLYADVVMATPGQHRLVGYVRMHLGSWAGRLEAFSSVIGLFGASLAYLILGGLFIAQIFGPELPVPPFWGAALLFIFGVLAVRKGTTFLSAVDFWMTLVEMGSILLLAAIASTAIKTEHLLTFNVEHALVPYGIILFAYGGLTVVTEVREIVGDDARRVRRSVIAGTLMAVGLTIAFATAVVGALGPTTTTESIGGLSAAFGGHLPRLGALAGFFSILTSYIVFTDYLNKQFCKDFNVRPILASIAAVGFPFMLYLMGVRSFGRILELVGAVLIGVEGMFVSMMYLKVKREKRDGMLKVPNLVVYFLLLVYAAGALYALFGPR